MSAQAKEPTIVIFSRERQHTGTTWKLFPNHVLMVNENEVDAYREAGHDGEIWTHNCNRIPAIRNRIMERIGAGNNLIIMDDDIKKVGKFVQRANGKVKAVTITGEEFYNELVKGFRIAEKNKYHMFGISPTTNPLNFNPKHRIKTSVFVLGAMICMVVRDDLRNDESLTLKTDYELTARCMQIGGGVFRLAHLWMDVDYDKMAGGRALYKTEEDYKNSFTYLLEKYPKYFRPHPRREWELILSDPANRKR